jgi:hypothetical protein
VTGEEAPSATDAQ